jgi:hypothetical protein
MDKIAIQFGRWSVLALFLALLCSCGGAPTGAGTTAGAGSTTGVSGEEIKLGTGGGSSFSAGVAEATLLRANSNNASWSIAVVVVDSNNLAVTQEYTVAFSSTCVSTGLSALTSESVVTLAGRASTTYDSGTCSGIDTVVASVISGTDIISALIDLDISDARASSGGESAPVVLMGNGTSTSFQDGVLFSTATSIQAGGSATISVNLVDIDGSPYTPVVPITFSSGCVANGTSIFSSSEVSTSGGTATTVYTTNGCRDLDIISATAVINEVNLSAAVTLDIAADSVLSVQFVSIGDTILSLPGAGGDETTDVTFRLLGSLGAPVAGDAVSFRLSSSIGGVRVAPGREAATSDLNGLVTTTVQSGTVSTTFTVIATHDATGNLTTSDGIVVSSGIPVDSKFSLSFSSFTPKEAFDTDGITVDLGIIASDYFGNDVPDGAQVFFASPESGNIDKSCILESGECSVVWRSSGLRPVDFRASVIAYIDGAEDFTDNNGNAVYDASDSLGADLGEPFIDEDESGLYDIGEFFVDSNENGVRDVANGLWDGPCLVAVDPMADCSGGDGLSIWKVGVIRMPTSTPRLVYAAVDYGDGLGEQDLVLGGLINMELSAGNSATLTFEVADSNALADQFGGHPMPSGSGIFVSSSGSSGVTFSGDSSLEVPAQAIAPTRFSVIVLRDTDDSIFSEQFLDVSVHESFSTLSDELGEFTFRLRI